MTPLQEVTLRRLQGQFESEIKQGHRTGALIVYYPMPAPAIDVMQLVNLAGNLPPITDITAEFLEGRLGGSTRLEKDRTHGSTLWLHGDANSLQLFDMLTADCCRALSIGCKSDLIFEWTRLLFVLGWRKIPGSPLWIDKWTVNGSLRFGAADRPLSADSSMDRFYQSIYNGAEPFTASALPDLFVASVKAIDLYLTRTVEPPLTDKTEHDGTTPNLIELLATKPENESLSDEDYAFLCAFLNQPGNRLSLSRLQRGEADPFAKLRLIQEYNGNLRKQSRPKELPRDEGTINGVAPTLDKKTGQGEGNGRKPKPKSRRKRTDPRADKMLSEAWETGQYKTHTDLAIAKGITTREVKLAIDRHRKRQAAKGLPRKKPRQ